MSVSNLASVLQDQGKYEAAEEMIRRALKGMEKVLGEEHSDTLTMISCLAFVLHRQKKYRDAVTFYERSCTGFWKLRGINHPTTRDCFGSYCSMIKEMKDDSVGPAQRTQ